ncbi:glycine cleavage system aminomethyltransferase GcvT [bacterium]|nr:glycine cleavage system aminomethyltransferase GcvT [bacterium]
MKQTLLHDKQIKLGAKMVDFAGWHMPVQFTSIIEEHKNVRKNAGLFDVSHMGEVFVSGKDSLNFLNKIVPQDISKLYNSKAVYCQLTNENGGLVDDLIIYKLEDNKYLLIVNASRIDEDVNWFVRNSVDFDVYIDNQSHNYSLLAVQGPKADSILRKLGYNLEQEFFTIEKTTLNSMDVMVSRTGYTGEDGYEIMLKNKDAVKMWDLLIDAGKEFSLMPIGLGARDTLRLEAALHLYGNDLNEITTPVEAGLSWSIPKDKTEDYNGKNVIMNQIQNGTDKKLIGLKMLSRAVPRHEYEVYYNHEKIGNVTSGGFAPSLNENIALAYVKNLKELKIGSTIQIMVREKLYDAQIVKRPFVEKHNNNKEK